MSLARLLVCPVLALLAVPVLAGPASPAQPLARLNAPAVSLTVSDAGVSALTDQGELWTLRPLTRRASDLSPDAPLTTCAGEVVGVGRGGRLWWGGGTTVEGLSALAGPVCAPGGTLLVVTAAGELARVEGGPRAARLTRRAALKVLPDARPHLADLRGDGQPSVALLALPGDRLTHGVLGDTLEAAALLIVAPDTLAVQARLDLPAPFVFEDWEARPVREGARDRLALVRSDPARGAALLLVGDADRTLRVLAVGPDFGRGGRWLAPLTDGAALYAVHTPHIGGVLHRYARSGAALHPTALTGQVSNHRIGQRRVTGGVWQGEVWIGSQDGRQTVRVRPGGTVTPALGAAPSSPLLITSRGAFLGLEDRQVVRLPDRP